MCYHNNRILCGGGEYYYHHVKFDSEKNTVICGFLVFVLIKFQTTTATGDSKQRNIVLKSFHLHKSMPWSITTLLEPLLPAFLPVNEYESFLFC